MVLILDPKIIDVINIKKIGKTLIDNKKSNFLSFKLIFNLIFLINSQIKMKKGIIIPICLLIKTKGNQM